MNIGQICIEHNFFDSGRQTDRQSDKTVSDITFVEGQME